MFLRVLEEGVFYRIGGTTPISVDVRVISATNKDIALEVDEGRFREDLYYRLNVVQIRMPALQERKEDIPLLANYYLDIFRQEKGLPRISFSEKAMQRLMDHDWPGNVRELRNVVERCVVMGNGEEIRPDDLLIVGKKSNQPGMEVGLTLKEALDRFKKDFITLNLKNTAGNRSEAARVMDIQRTYLSRLITKYGVH